MHYQKVNWLAAHLHTLKIVLTPDQAEEVIRNLNVEAGRSMTSADVKQQAKALQQHLKTLGHPLKYMKALDVIAQLHGAKRWDAVVNAKQLIEEPLEAAKNPMQKAGEVC